MKILRPFQEHPHSVGETYLEHARHAGAFSASLLYASTVAAIHAVFPWMHENTASKIIRRLHDKMVLNRQSRAGRSTRRDFVAENI